MARGTYQIWDLLYPPPPDTISREDPRIELNSPTTEPGLQNTGRFIDELTGWGFNSWQEGEQNGLRKNAEDYGSWEQRESYEGTPAPIWQLRAFGGTDD